MRQSVVFARYLDIQRSDGGYGVMAAREIVDRSERVRIPLATLYQKPDCLRGEFHRAWQPGLALERWPTLALFGFWSKEGTEVPSLVFLLPSRKKTGGGPNSTA